MDSRVQRQMIIWTLLLVVGLGAISTLFLIQPPSTVSIGARDGSEFHPRSPASIDRTATPSFDVQIPAKPVANAIDFDIECNAAENKVSFRPNVRQVRLSGSLCGKNKKNKVRQTEVVNRANGLMATVFFPEAGAYTTDYIALADGANHITIKHSFENGQIESHELIFDRQPAVDSKRR